MPLLDENTFTRQTRRPAEAGLVVAYARAFNLGRPSEVLDRLAPDVVYASQSAWEDLVGRDAVADYLGGQIATARKSRADLLVRVEVGILPREKRPCALLWQRPGGLASEGLGRRQFAMQIEADERGRARHLFSATHVPDPARVPGTGWFPGLTAEQIEADRSYRPVRISRDSPLEFLVFHLEGIPRTSEAMDAAVEAVAAAYPNAVIRSHELDPGGADVPPEVHKFDIKGFPSLVVRSGSTPVLVHTGALRAGTLRRKLARRLYDPGR